MVNGLFVLDIVEVIEICTAKRLEPKLLHERDIKNTLDVLDQ